MAISGRLSIDLAAGVPRRVENRELVHWMLRVAVAWCFIGHGAFGIITKADWVPYFALMGIPEWLAWRLMPLVGTMDISIGVLTLFHPVRAALAWGAFWGTWTALLRPLGGQGGWEFLERAGNFGAPLAMLYLSGWGQGVAAWFRAEASPARLGRAQLERLRWILRITTATLLIGHGGFGAFMHKAVWVEYFRAAGIGADTVQAASLIPLVGWLEIVLGLAVLARPVGGVLLLAFAWKVGTESLRVLAGEPVWEFIERGGSYGAPLALLIANGWLANAEPDVERVEVAQAAPEGQLSLAISSVTSRLDQHVPRAA